MTSQELFEQIVAKKSFLCVGLDTDMRKLPAHLKDSDDAIFEFNRAIIDATAPFTVAYKPKDMRDQMAGLLESGLHIRL